MKNVDTLPLKETSAIFAAIRSKPVQYCCLYCLQPCDATHLVVGLKLINLLFVKEGPAKIDRVKEWRLVDVSLMRTRKHDMFLSY